MIRIKVGEIFDKLRRAKLLKKKIDVYLKSFKIINNELLLFYIPLLSNSIEVFYFPLFYVNCIEDFINESEYAKYMSFLETKKELSSEDIELFVKLKKKFEQNTIK